MAAYSIHRRRVRIEFVFVCISFNVHPSQSAPTREKQPNVNTCVYIRFANSVCIENPDYYCSLNPKIYKRTNLTTSLV